MARIEIRMPRFDPAMEEGRVAAWHKRDGDVVREGEVLGLVEGEKSMLELRAPATGRLRLLVKEGSAVKVGALLAELESEAAEVLATPMAKRLAKEHGLDLAGIKGTGPRGSITAEDVMRQLAAGREATIPSGTVRRSRLEGLRKAISDRLSYSWRTAVPTAISMEFLAQRLLELSSSSGIGLNAFFVKACARALLEHPELNCTIEGEEVLFSADVNIAFAVHTDKGLLAPVLRNVSSMPLAEVARRLEELTERARKGALRPEETLGHTFTISNLGSEGVDFFAPIINPPACAILGVGAIRLKPVAIEGELRLGHVGTLTLVFDHRVIDGVPASRFLARVKQLLEDPRPLLEG
jgi:pyruvate dehydrogenase E2 component (dihydrolipoamide acetyltransferase)